MTLGAVAQAIKGLDAWLDTMRGLDGYGGPVAHWWQNCLHFTGAGLDWRYEGIIIGYLNLFEKTGDRRWLDKAQRAGDDLIRGQLRTGNFRDSSFELNPYTGGTPHEAACDVALLRLAEVLRDQGDPTWHTYLAAAERNLRLYYIHELWDPDAGAFRDHPRIPSLVPNKAATLVEALLLLAQLEDDEALAEVYALPTLEAILAHQCRGGELDGAIYQYSNRGRFVEKFFPYYVARCVPGLVAGHEWMDGGGPDPVRSDRFLDAARRAMMFVLQWRYDDGGFPQVVYPAGRVNRYPQWVAATGDILRVMTLMKPYGLEVDSQPTLEWLMRGYLPTGGCRTAYGFASQISQRTPGRCPDFRDLLPVCGWSDKAFRYLTQALPTGRGLNGDTDEMKAACVFRGQQLTYFENREWIRLQGALRDNVIYEWRKGESWPRAFGSLMHLK